MTRKVDNVEGGLVIATGAVLAGLGVAAGAFGAHLLKEKLSAADLDIWRTAASYQMYHALALIVVGRLLARHPSRLLRASSWLFILGVLLFSGSLYTLALSSRPEIGALTPFGGVAFLGGWACLAVGVVRSANS